MWYLVGAVEQELRVFRISRVQFARITDLSFTRPAFFDLAAFWEQWSEQWSEQVSTSLRHYEVRVHVAPALTPVLKLRYGKEIGAQLEQANPPNADDWIGLNFTFETEEVACSHILSFGTMIEVVEPQELREKVAQIATRIAAFYSDDQRTLTGEGESS